MEAEYLERDLATTLRNRDALFRRPNLLFWYRRLYAEVLGPPASLAGLRVLEIGSGTSPLKHFYPGVITSDVLPLPHVDLVFDAHQIDRVEQLAPGSIDLVAMSNVLHHLRAPLEVLLKIHGLLRPGGRVVAVEPYYSSLSRAVWTRLHHEPSDFSTPIPGLASVSGPLSTANMAVPHLIFFGGRGWSETLRGHYRLEDARFGYHTSLSYLATGGISRSLPIPHRIYRLLWALDHRLAARFPARLASFFSASLPRGAPQPGGDTLSGGLSAGVLPTAGRARQDR